MKLFAGMSIRAVLGQIIGVLGFLLVALCTVELGSAVDRNTAAQRVASLAGTDQQLFATLMGYRLERGTTIPALISEAPADVADTRVATNREISETGYHAVVERLAGTSDSTLAPLLARLTAAHEALAPLRSKSDAATHRPKSERDASIAQEYPKAAQAYLDAILALTGGLEASLKMVDPVVDQLLTVKQAAWAARSFGGLVAVRIEANAAAGQPFSQADIVAAAEDRGRAALAWSQTNEAVARADAPAAIVNVVARSKDPAALATLSRQQEIVKAMSNGQKAELPVSELQKINTASLTPGVEVANAALAEMVARAGD